MKVINWDQYFMGVAKLSGLRSKDPSTKVGACIVNNKKRIVGIGYNGLPEGLDDKKYPWDIREGKEVETKYPYVVHAEANAILNSKTDLEATTIYVSLFPCHECCKLIINSGIKTIKYESDKYGHTDLVKAGKRMLEDAGVEFIKLEEIEVILNEKDKKGLVYAHIFGLNIPNFISFIRILLIIPAITFLLLDKNGFSTVEVMDAVVPMNYIISFIIFIVSANTDWIDGYIARKYDLVTTFGKFIDPIADKLLVNSIVIIFTYFGYIPVWATLVIILRDIVVDSIRMFLASQNIVLAANSLGKFKTIFQMIALPIIYLANETTWAWGYDEVYQHLVLAPLYLAVLFSFISGVVYLKGGWPHITQSK